MYGRWSAVLERTVIDLDLQVCFRIVTLQRESYTLNSPNHHHFTNAIIKMGYLRLSHFFNSKKVLHLFSALHSLVHFFPSLGKVLSDRHPSRALKEPHSLVAPLTALHEAPPPRNRNYPSPVLFSFFHWIDTVHDLAGASLQQSRTESNVVVYLRLLHEQST